MLVQCFYQWQLTIGWQQFLDFAHNTLSQFSNSDSTGLLYLLSRQLKEVRTRANDVANWPNPFQGLDLVDFQDRDAPWLELIDGASNQENIPFGPLIVRARALDVIVTIEGSADDPINNWPKWVNKFHYNSWYSVILLVELVWSSAQQGS